MAWQDPRAGFVAEAGAHDTITSLSTMLGLVFIFFVFLFCFSLCSFSPPPFLGLYLPLLAESYLFLFST